VKEPDIIAGFVTRKTIDWVRIRVGDICKFAEVRVAVLVLDEGVSVPV
jgi:hypothetical protein